MRSRHSTSGVRQLGPAPGAVWIGKLACSTVLALPLLSPATEMSARHWTSCVPATVIPPYLSNDPARPGIIERLMTAAGKEVGLEVDVQYMPLPRCMAMLERGTVDAALSAPSHASSRFARFPVQDSKLHAAQSIARVKVLLVARESDAPYWSPPRSRHSTEPAPVVAVRRRMSTVIEPLMAFGFRVDESTVALEAALGMLRRGRVDYAAVIEEELLAFQKTSSLQGLRIERPPALELDYYAGVSTARWAADEELVKRWWSAMARLKHSPGFSLR